MTAPANRPARGPLVTGSVALFLRIVAACAVVATLIAGFLVLAGVTQDRIAAGIIAAGVALGCLVLI